MKKVIISILIGLSVFNLTQCGNSEKQVKEETKKEVKAELEKEQEEKDLKEKGYSQKDIEGITKEQYQEWENNWEETYSQLGKVIGVCCPAQEGYDYCNAEQAQQYMEQVRLLQQQYSDSFPDFIKEQYDKCILDTFNFANNIINTGNVNQNMTEEQKTKYNLIYDNFSVMSDLLDNLKEDIN